MQISKVINSGFWNFIWRLPTAEGVGFYRYWKSAANRRIYTLCKDFIGVLKCYFIFLMAFHTFDKFFNITVIRHNEFRTKKPDRRAIARSL